MNERLKLCPFCGGEAKSYPGVLGEVYCPLCGATTPRGENSCELWNKRTKNELKPCPLCGGDAEICKTYTRKYIARCKQCGFETGLWYMSEEAISAWSMRFNDDKV